MKIKVPVIRRTDVLLVGGTVHACELAVKLAAEGKRVFCITANSYFGDDVCSALDLVRMGPIGSKDVTYTHEIPTPAQVKQSLNGNFLNAGVEYLFQTHPVAPAYDAERRIAGLLIANRSGFQVIAARTIIDATEHALVARMAGVPVDAFAAGEYNVSLNLIGDAAKGPGQTVSVVTDKIVDVDKCYTLYRVDKKFRFEDGSIDEYARADAAMRRAAWASNTCLVADKCVVDLRDGVSETYKPTAAMPVFIASRTTCGEMLSFLAECASTEPVAFHDAPVINDCEIVRKDEYFRFRDCADTLEFDLNGIGEIASYDVVVCGGGTGGAPAAISAARAGAKTLCVEQLSLLGGVMTAGMICAYWFGNITGFTDEIDAGVIAMSPVSDRRSVRAKQNWLLSAALEAGASVYFNSTVIAAGMAKDDTLCGVVVATPRGVGFVRAKSFVDATGNADLVAAAGGETVPEVAPEMAHEPAVQGASVCPISLNKNCTNADYTFVLDSDVFDATRAFTMATGKYVGCFDVTQLLDTRERRRIAGQVTLQPQDFFANRTWADTVTVARSNFDTHGFIQHPMFMLKATEHAPYDANVPFRAMLPRNLTNIVVTGLAVSAHRDCMPLIRMQPDVQNQGYAAGLAAAMTAQGSGGFSTCDIKKLQKKLVEKKIISEEVMQSSDGYGPATSESSHFELASIFSDPKTALPGLRARFKREPDLETAMILAFLGDDSGRELLVGTIASQGWDDGWSYRGMGQFGPCLSALDTMIHALSRIGGDRNVLLDKLRALESEDAFSHFRSICLALIQYPDKRAVRELDRLLDGYAMTGHAIRTLSDTLAANRISRDDNTVRNAQLKELYLAKALVACQPESARGRMILDIYAKSLNGHYALFAGR